MTIDLHGFRGSPNVQLFAFDRPGYGRSDFSPFDFKSVAEDAVAAADALHIDTFAVVGHSGGGPFALALGALVPDRVSALGVTASPVPYRRVPFAWTTLSEIDRRASEVARTDQAAAARLFGIDFEPVAATLRSGRENVRDYLITSLPADVRTLSDSSILEIFATSLEEGVRQGWDGCAWDNVAWVSDWHFPLADVRQEVFMWYGEGDVLMPKRFGQWLSAQLPRCVLTVWDDCGHLGLFAHWREVFAAVVDVR